MKECNYGRIPPCYGSLERAIYEEAKQIDKLRAKLMEGGFADDTHDKVYGVNKQMCDIGKTMNNPMKPLSEAAIQEIAKALEIIRNPKGIIMEEKKTKKMTKAEAFEYLKGKKVKCYLGHNYVGKLLLTKIIECGFKSEITVPEGNEPFSWAFFMSKDGDTMMLDLAFADTYGTYECGEINAEELLSIEIVDGEDNIAEKNAFQKARDIMKWLREEQSPHTLMIIDGYHVELLDGVKAEVWKE